MVVKGHIENGCVALDEPLGLPNGTPVEIRPLVSADANGAAHSSGASTSWRGSGRTRRW